ncbi:MAG TPA: polyprenol monophosphomannose synthase [Candidatus Sulfotelmatobacter sp.]|nr:polyprenol monophosphomannose synthase [Candidatus Sulfotelmatobacter sp.]
MPRALVCTPTYNEAPNIQRLIDAILAAVPDAELLVIDDASPDGTGALVQERTLKNARLNLMERPGKLGLGTAYFAAFAYGLQHDFDRIITMDADFSHPPDRIPALIEAVDQGADLAIGSRYVPGGAISGWGPGRRMLSATANGVARTFLGLRTHDCTGGFRCYSRPVVEFLVTRPLRSSGYSALVELLTRCERRPFRIREVPITFVDRTHGQSKISRQEVLRAMATVLRLMRRSA